jgi:hypothetical protein
MRLIRWDRGVVVVSRSLSFLENPYMLGAFLTPSAARLVTCMGETRLSTGWTTKTQLRFATQWKRS